MSVLYVLKRFPRLSETFVIHELLRVEAAPEPKKQLTRLQGGLSPRQGCAFSVD